MENLQLVNKIFYYQDKLKQDISDIEKELEEDKREFNINYYFSDDLMKKVYLVIYRDTCKFKRNYIEKLKVNYQNIINTLLTNS